MAQRYTKERSAATRQGIASIHGREINITPPVDWTITGAPSFQLHLHSLFFLDPLLQAYVRDSDRRAFDLAVAVARDWINGNQIGDDRTSFYAWHDKATGDRAPYLAFLLRIGACRGALADEEALALCWAVRDHGQMLADESRYAAGTNHGLFQDRGLLLLAKYMDEVLPEAPAWYALGAKRFKANLASHISASDALWLEHSAGYHADTVNLIHKVDEQTPILTSEFKALTSRMVDAAGWLVTPGRKLVQLGDTNLRPARRWLTASAEGKSGLKTFRDAGWAIVKERDSYLAVAASYHSSTHKHADELSFELYDSGRRVVVDSGKYAYDNRDPFRLYARSAEAHNGLIIDGAGGQWWRRKRPYGSGILATGHSAGWYVIQATNPLCVVDGVRHLRFLIYRPTVVLVIVDVLSSARSHTYQRLFHLAPGIEPLIIRDRTVGTTRRVVRGQRQPVQGWTFPDDQQAVPIDTVILETKMSSGVLTAEVALRDDAPMVGRVEAAEERLVVGLGKQTVTIARTGDHLAISGA